MSTQYKENIRTLSHEAYWLSPYRLTGFPIDEPHSMWDGDEKYWVQLDPHIRVAIYSWHELYDDGVFVGREDPKRFDRQVREFVIRRGQWAHPDLVEAQVSFPDLFDDIDDYDIYGLRDVELEEMTTDEIQQEMAR
jgi:hypothetical protein